jgi:predicted glycosyltransferase
MNLAVFSSTPAQVHFYKNIAANLRKRGHKIYFLARDYGETLDILNELGFEYFVFSKPPRGAKKVLALPIDVLRAVSWLRDKNIDIVTGFEIYGAYTSKLIRIPYVQFSDSEPMVHNTLLVQYKLTQPAVDVLLTPDTFRCYLGKKHLKVASYKELAYLHPNYYSPKEDILDLLGVEKQEDYVLLRFNAFDAVHDIGKYGFTVEDKILLVREIEKYARVFISSEAKDSEIFKDKIVNIPKSRIHDALFYAKLLVTDTQTMATEAALLGTPAIRCNRFVGEKDMGNFIELEKRFGLLFNIRDPKEAIKKAEELIQIDDIKREWQRKRERLLEKKIDMTAFMVWFIENYPESLYKFRENPQIQYRFR